LCVQYLLLSSFYISNVVIRLSYIQNKMFPLP